MPTNGTMGDIQLSVGLKAGDVKKSAETLSNAIKHIFESTAGKKVDDNFKNLQMRMDKSVSRANQLTAKLEKLETTKVPTSEYKELEKQLALSTKELNRLGLAQEKLDNADIATKNTTAWKKSWDDLQSSVVRVRQEISVTKEEMNTLVNTGKAFTSGVGIAGYEAVKNQLNSVNNEMRKLIETNNVYARDYKAVHVIADFGNSIQQSKIESLSLSNAIKNNLTSAFHGLGATIKTALGNTTHSLIERLRGSVLGLGKSANSSDFNFKKLFTTLLRYGFGIRSIFMLIRRLRSAIAEGIKNMAQFNGGVNNTNRAITSLKDSLTYLKNSWGAAFAPILSIVAPILNTLIGMLASAANAIAAFFAILTGKKTVMRAVKTQSALGSAVGGTAKKLKEEGEEAKKTVSRLAEFDDLDILDPPEEDKLDDIADDLGGGGGGAANPIQFEEVPVEGLLPDSIVDLIERLKEAWANGDWYGVGLVLADGMNLALSVLDNWILTKFTPWAQVWAVRIAEILNGVVAGLDWELLGKTFADGVNGIFTSIHNFYEVFDFIALGDGIGRAIISGIENIKWGYIGKFFTDTINAKFEMLFGLVSAQSSTSGDNLGTSLGKALADGLSSAIKNLKVDTIIHSIELLLENCWDFIITFTSEFEWEEFGEQLDEVLTKGIGYTAELLGSTDMSELTDGISKGILNAIKNISLSDIAAGLVATIMLLLIKVVYDLFADLENLFTLIDSMIIQPFAEWLEEQFGLLGGYLVAGLFEGIIEDLQNIKEWLKTNMIDPIVNGVKELFGISSPSTVFKEIGKWIMEGLFQGITEMVKKVLSAWEDLKKKAIDLFNKMKDEVTKAWESMWSGMKGIINKIIGGVESFANSVVRAINKVIDAINSLSVDFPSFDTPFGSFGGFSLGFNLGHIGEISIPRLAQGAVIPPNREFLAMLGDQQSGTNIEAPLDVITQAMRDALSDMNFGQSQYSEMTLDGETFARLIVPYVISELNRTGYAVNLLEG